MTFIASKPSPGAPLYGWSSRAVGAETGKEGRVGARRRGDGHKAHLSPATRKLWEPVHGIGTSRSHLQTEESNSKMRGGADRLQPCPALPPKRASASRSLEMAWQAWDAKREKGASNDTLTRTHARHSLEMASRPHLFALARNCPRMTTRDVATVLTGPLMREYHWPSVPHVC